MLSKAPKMLLVSPSDNPAPVFVSGSFEMNALPFYSKEQALVVV